MSNPAVADLGIELVNLERLVAEQKTADRLRWNSPVTWSGRRW